MGRVQAFRVEFTKEQFKTCVAQVDVNIDMKLKSMLGGFFRIFAESINRQYFQNENNVSFLPR